MDYKRCDFSAVSLAVVAVAGQMVACVAHNLPGSGSNIYLDQQQGHRSCRFPYLPEPEPAPAQDRDHHQPELAESAAAVAVVERVALVEEEQPQLAEEEAEHRFFCYSQSPKQKRPITPTKPKSDFVRVRACVQSSYVQTPNK
jgi:hypothetical protein